MRALLLSQTLFSRYPVMDFERGYGGMGGWDN